MTLRLACFLFLFSTKTLLAQTPDLSLSRSKSITSTKWQQYFSLEYLGFSLHPGGGSMPQHYPLKVDAKAWLVLQVGVVANYDVEISKRFFIRSAAGYYSDCAFLPSGFLHLGIRWTAIRRGRHEFNIGLGPTFLFREDWHQFPEYKDDAIFGNRVSGKWQYRFIFYGGEFEYLYRLNDRWQLQYSVVPGYPSVVTSKFGARFKF